jgi:hypothetical protein
MKELIYVAMVDKKELGAMPADLEMIIRDGVTPEVEGALRNFMLQCTASYNVASRKFNIWSLLHTHLDEPIAKTLHHFDLPKLFNGSFSSWLRLRSMAEANLFFKLNIRASQFNPELVANLESILEISYFSLARKPSRRIEVSKLKGATQHNYRKKVDHRHYPYCELCWRLCQAAERNMESPEKSFATLRFCSVHDPSVPDSKYRQDHRFRLRFHDELKKCRTEIFSHKLTEAEMRAVAYNESHKREGSLSAKIRNFYNDGVTQIEISKKLGISRQAVSKSLKNCKASPKQANTNKALLKD